MAGDWIKMRINLDTDPRVIAMAAQLNVPELHIVGCCWKVWAWADSHTEDGNAIRVTDVTLDRFTGVTGFAAALRNVGWLEGRDNALTFPRFAEHNGQTAKKRGETAIRVAKCRNAKRVTHVTQKVLPEKRREEKSISSKEEIGMGKPTKPKKPIPPTIEEVAAYCQERANGVNPQKFIDHYAARGWMIGKNKMKDWEAAVRTWESNDYGPAKPQPLDSINGLGG